MPARLRARASLSPGGGTALHRAACRPSRSKKHILATEIGYLKIEEWLERRREERLAAKGPICPGDRLRRPPADFWFTCRSRNGLKADLLALCLAPSIP